MVNILAVVTPERTRWTVLVCAALFVAAATAVDIAVGPRAVLVGLLIIGPLAMGTVWGPRQTALFSLPVVLIAALQFLWNDNAGSWSYPVPLAVVGAASWAAVAGAWMREQALGYERQVRVLSGELSASEAQLAAVLEHAGEAIIARRVDGSLVFANEAAAQILGVDGVGEIATITPEQMMHRFEVYDEAGREVALEDLPGTQILRGAATEPPEIVVRNVDRRTGQERWLRNKATAVRGPDGTVTMAVNLIEDVTARVRAQQVERLLAEAGEALSSSLDYERTLQTVAELAVPRLADWCGVDLPDDTGAVVPVAIVHRDPAMVEGARALRAAYPSRVDSPNGAGRVIRTGDSVLVEQVTEEMLAAAARDAAHLEGIEALRLRSVMIVPMCAAGGGVLGAITFASTSARRYSTADLRVAEELGRRAGVAIENARLYEERARVAHTLQSALLPPTMPEIEGWEIATSYRPAGAVNEVGGDFFDAVRVRGGWAVMIGDVAGKGARAAALTALARHTLHTALELTGDARAAVAHLNRRLERRAELSLATAAVVTVLDADGVWDGEVEVVAAGHPLPLVVRPAGAVQPAGEPRQLLGAFPAGENTWARGRVTVRAGDVVVLYTDGVLDAVGEDGERFGEARLLAVLGDARGDSAEDVVRAVEHALESFACGSRGDDVALVALRRRS
ncbi:MAG TPA: SpoIIE family protein phosphatase [Capillimicrobium sp.]